LNLTKKREDEKIIHKFFEEKNLKLKK